MNPSFSYEGIKYPASLFGYVMSKGNKVNYVVAIKSQLGDSWVEDVEEDHLPPTDGNVVLLVDAMAFIHQQDTRCKKFLSMATRYLHKLLGC